MENRSEQKFRRIERDIICPICRSAMRNEGMSMVCGSGHCFDISKKGFANFLPNQKPLRGYDAAFFQSRSRVFEKGIYGHLLDGVTDCVKRHAAETDALLVDAGCGDGYYARALSRANIARVIGIDASKEAIHAAACGTTDAAFIVADVACMPVADGCADFVLDAFSPANYAEFSRVLRNGGLLIKLVPTENHMRELRHALGGRLRGGEYSNEKIVDLFCEKFDLTESVTLSRTTPVDAETAGLLAAMSPLAFGAREGVDVTGIEKITVEALMLVGTKK